MKSQIRLYFLVVLFLIGLWLFVRSNSQSPSAVLPAVVNRDCAPWDGGAFTVSIPQGDGSSIAISIYHSPDLQFPASYSFPDASMQEGHAQLVLPTGTPEALTGKVWFQRVDQDAPVEGRFQFHAKTGMQLEGRFFAEWGDQVVYCG